MLDVLYAVLMSGLMNVYSYLSEHVLTCLIPAFFIAGAISAFIKKEAILKYLGPDVKKTISYPIASISGAVLAVCSCTILPMFAGLYKKGSGVGPATAFLYSGPAINILAIVYTANQLGFELGLARAVAAVGMAFVIAFVMSNLFKTHDEETSKNNKNTSFSDNGPKRSKWVKLSVFILLIAILVTGTAGISWALKIGIIYLFSMAIAVIMIYYYETHEVTEWGYETWDLTKKIFPILIVGTFIVGVIAYFLPPETFKPYLGDNSLLSSFFGSIIGAILYMPTLLEVPIIGTTFGYNSGVMGDAPALSLLLAGPSLSLPNMIVLFRIMKFKHWVAYIAIVVVLSTLMGFTYGMIV
ncbi:MAG: permease [Candidatus Thermoplasmatota archaeon]|nr:permease [Candidatus Thermoplasmatota archaeon]MBS3790643.1 permease [Candidatus Thermoplasmatota archaeon]